MMAADNDEVYGVAPSFVLETVGAAKTMILKQKDQTARSRGPINCYRRCFAKRPTSQSFDLYPHIDIWHPSIRLKASPRFDPPSNEI